jgi:hypothetical protein
MNVSTQLGEWRTRLADGDGDYSRALASWRPGVPSRASEPSRASRATGAKRQGAKTQRRGTNEDETCGSCRETRLNSRVPASWGSPQRVRSFQGVENDRGETQRREGREDTSIAEQCRCTEPRDGTRFHFGHDWRGVGDLQRSALSASPRLWTP